MQDQVMNTSLMRILLPTRKKGPFANKLARTCQNFDYNLGNVALYLRD
jgi:hypothetical protein